MLTLTDDELRELTGKLRSDAQRRALDALGVRYGVRPNNSLVVLRAHVEALYGVTPSPTPAAKEGTGSVCGASCNRSSANLTDPVG